MLLGLSAAAGMVVLSEPIIKLIYGALEQQEVIYAKNILSIMAWGIIFLTLIQTLTAILQGINRTVIPVQNLFIGAIFKVIISYTLVGIPGFNIIGAAVGSVVCFGVAAILDLMAVVRHVRIPFQMEDLIVKPIIAVGVMAAGVSISYNQLFSMFNSNARATVIAIFIGTVIYGAVLLITGAIRRQDFELLPGGKIVGRIFSRLGL